LRIPEPIEEDIRVSAAAIRSQKCLAENEVARGPAIGHNMQHELIRAGRPTAVAGLRTIPPLHLNAASTEQLGRLILSMPQDRLIDTDAVVHENRNARGLIHLCPACGPP
jgi:hypothetical protein